MTPISIKTDWKKGDKLFASDLNNDFNAIQTAINNLIGATAASGDLHVNSVTTVTDVTVGGTLKAEGAAILSGDPLTALGAATKQYVDGLTSTTLAAVAQTAAAAASKLPLAGGTLLGPLTLHGAPVGSLEAATKAYVDSEVAGGGAGQGVLRAGDTMTGPLILAADPTVDLGAATKQYADRFLPLTGGSMSGPIGLVSDPTLPLQPTTKRYVDAADTLSVTSSAANVGRNRLRNSWMEIQQRGLGPFTAAGYTADGWISAPSAGGTISTSIVATPSVGYGPPRYVLSASGTIPAAGWLVYIGRIEAADCFDLVGQSVTVSFYGAATTSAGTLQGVIQLFHANAADNFSGVTMIGQVNVALGATPQRLSATFANLPAGAANGIAAHFLCNQSGATGNMLFNASGMQLESAAAPTALEKPSVSADLAKCQRFYEPFPVHVRGYAAAGGFVDSSIYFKAAKKSSIPTISQLTAGTIGNVSSLNIYSVRPDGARAEVAVIATGDAYALDFLYAASSEL